MRFLYILPLFAASVLFSGCGPAGPEYIPVKGIATLDGKPLALKTLFFVPEPGTPGMGAGASTDENGAYELLAVAAGATEDVRGVLPGSYRVTVAEPMFPLGTELVVQGLSDEPDVAIGTPEPAQTTAQPIPREYSSKESTPLRVQVVPEGRDINLELTSTS